MKKIGLVVGSRNAPMISDFRKICGDMVSIHFTRETFGLGSRSSELRPYTRDEVEEGMNAVLKGVREAAARLANADIDLLVYGCMTWSFMKADADERIVRAVKEESGISVITAANALIKALRKLKIHKVSVGTPYQPDVDEKLKAFLNQNDFGIAKLKGLNSPVSEHAKITHEVIYNLAKEVNVPEADGVLISCTQLRVVDIIQRLEDDLRKPIVSPNQASAWLALREIGIHQGINGFGRLLGYNP